MKPTNKLMKKLLAIITLSLCFMLPSQADDIKDFQIEGISIGDSLLDYLSKREIKRKIFKIGVGFSFQKVKIIPIDILKKIRKN